MPCWARVLRVVSDSLERIEEGCAGSIVESAKDFVNVANMIFHTFSIDGSWGWEVGNVEEGPDYHERWNLTISRSNISSLSKERKGSGHFGALFVSTCSSL